MVSSFNRTPAAAAYEPLGHEPPKKQGCSCRCCCSCCRVCCKVFLGISGTVAALLLWVLLRVATASCTLDSFDYRLILPATGQAAGLGEKIELATSENTELGGLDLDLLGVWWMDGNPLVAEQLVSFAGAHGKPPYPTVVHVPTSGPRRWTWSDNFVGRAIIAYYAMTEPADVEHQFSFANESYADIKPVSDLIPRSASWGSTNWGARIRPQFSFANESYADIKPVSDLIPGLFGFRNIDADEWDRVDTYILRRIVYANGTAGPFWDKFVDWYTGEYPSGRLLVQKDSSTCKRRCQYFSPCFLCDVICPGLRRLRGFFSQVDA